MDIEVKGVAKTAFFVTALRALESERSDGLIKDEYAKHLIGDKMMKFISNPENATLLKEFSSVRNLVMSRTVISDSLIQEGIKQKNIRQIVNLGCGLDSRPYRLDLPPELKYYEIDVPDVLNYKDNVLSKMNVKPKCQLTRIAMDLTNKDEWVNELLKNTFDKNQPTIFIMEGLIVYLHKEEAQNLFKAISNLSASGSYAIGDMNGEAAKIFLSKFSGNAKNMEIEFHLECNILNFLQELGYDMKTLVFTDSSTDKYVAINNDDTSKILFYSFKATKN